jgi:hypothetical protein
MKAAKLKIIGFIRGLSRRSTAQEGCLEIYRDPADPLARYDESLLTKDAPLSDAYSRELSEGLRKRRNANLKRPCFLPARRFFVEVGRASRGMANPNAYVPGG